MTACRHLSAKESEYFSDHRLACFAGAACRIVATCKSCTLGLNCGMHLQLLCPDDIKFLVGSSRQMAIMTACGQK